MAFVLTLLYVIFALLSPSVLPPAIMSLHVMEILGALTILSLLPTIGQAKLGSVPEPYLVFGVLLSAGLSILATGWIGHVMMTMIDFLPIIFTFYFIVISFRSLGQLRILVFVLLAVAFFIFAQGVIADHAHEMLSPYLEAELTHSDLVYRYRGLGVLSDPNDLAQLFVMVIPMLWLRWKPGQLPGNLLLTILPAGVLTMGLFYTHSRGGVVALLAVILFGFKEKIGFILSSIFAAGLLVALLALNVSGGRGMNEDDGGRIAAWITGLETFKTHPVFGVGIGNFKDYNDTGLTAHNSYVLCLSEVGLVGYFCWIGMIVSTWTGLSAMVRPETKKAGLGLPARGGAGPPQTFTLVKPLPAAGASPGPHPAHAGAIAGSGFASVAHRGNGNAVWRPSPMQGGGAFAGGEVAETDPTVYAAKVFRIALVGLLTSSFFLSRTFSMVFYIMLGMSTALKLVYRREHPEIAWSAAPPFKRIAVVIAGSVILLYVFVRVRGIH